MRRFKCVAKFDVRGLLKAHELRIPRHCEACPETTTPQAWFLRSSLPGTYLIKE
ncbi:MAG: hypothetical protein ACLFT5_07920 [Desulfovermiculus sp.]